MSEQLSQSSRSERKRVRERARRSEMSRSFSSLTKMLLKVDAGFRAECRIRVERQNIAREQRGLREERHDTEKTDTLFSRTELVQQAAECLERMHERDQQQQEEELPTKKKKRKAPIDDEGITSPLSSSALLKQTSSPAWRSTKAPSDKNVKMPDDLEHLTRPPLLRAGRGLSLPLSPIELAAIRSLDTFQKPAAPLAPAYLSPPLLSVPSVTAQDPAGNTLDLLRPNQSANLLETLLRSQEYALLRARQVGSSRSSIDPLGAMVPTLGVSSGHSLDLSQTTQQQEIERLHAIANSNERPRSSQGRMGERLR